MVAEPRAGCIPMQADCTGLANAIFAELYPNAERSHSTARATTFLRSWRDRGSHANNRGARKTKATGRSISQPCFNETQGGKIHALKVSLRHCMNQR